MKMTPPAIDVQSSILPKKRKFDLEIESLLYDDMAALLSAAQPLMDQHQQQQHCEEPVASFDGDFMQVLLSNMQGIMPMPTKDTIDSSWHTTENTSLSSKTTSTIGSSGGADGITSNTAAGFLDNFPDSLLQQGDCLQDPLMAPPSSVLPVDNDWFLLDNAPLFHEESACPSSPASSSASDESLIPPATPTVQAQQLMLHNNSSICDISNNTNTSSTPTSAATFNSINNSSSNNSDGRVSQLKQYLGMPESSGHAANERTVMIITGKVAQKSYGTEKRFLCPPPTTVVIGGLSPLNFRISAGGPKCQQTGVLDRTSDNHFKCTSKHLHINDLAEKRKQVTVTVDIQQLGAFTSKPIKVISKPSKKKQSSVKHLELCIHHGSTIALFNRIRSQTVSTKYLGVNESKTTYTGSLSYVARPSSWDPFVIWAVDGETGPIHYNQQVMLQCIKTGVMSPVMIVRKGTLRQQTNELGDPVSQLHRVAFELAAPAEGVHVGGNQYLACINDTVLTAALDPVADTAIWTIIGTDCATFTFWRPDNNSNNNDNASSNSTASAAGGAVTPFPDVQSATAEGKDRLLLLGNHLAKFLTVWLGDVKCCSLSYSHGNDSIVCILPSVDALAASSACTCLDNGTRRLPIFLVRESDGTAYRTNHFYTF